jgi:DNA-binding transcriptional MerR regulator
VAAQAIGGRTATPEVSRELLPVSFISVSLSLLLALLQRKQHLASSSRLEVKRVKDLDIAEVARRAGVPASTLRFYEEKRLIASVGRRGQRRLFDPGVLERLALIALGRAAGFSLDEIALMFAPDGRPRIDRQMLAAQADKLDKTIRQLSAMRDGLRHAAACPAPSHMECPNFRRYLQAAASGAIGAPTRTGALRAVATPRPSARLAAGRATRASRPPW